jgi:hypothetical protein
MDAYGVRNASAKLVFSWAFRSVLFARGSDASRSQNQLLWTRNFSHFLASSYLSIYCDPRSSGGRSGVSDPRATKRNAQIDLEAKGGVGEKNHFWQAKS